jgi:two-component system, LytTR family, response regulator
MSRAAFTCMIRAHWIQAAENYVQLHLAAARHLLHVPLSELQASLDPEVFMRIHRSCIANVRYFKELEIGPHGDYVLTLHSGVRLQASRTYHERIKQWASNPF